MMDRASYSRSHIYYVKIVEVIFDQLFCDVSEGEYKQDDEVLKECLSCGQVVNDGREKYQKNSFGHGLIMLKLSLIEKKLNSSYSNSSQEAMAIQILTKCLGSSTDALLNELIGFFK